MGKIAVVRMSADALNVKFVEVNKNKSFIVYNQVSMPVNLVKDFYSDYFIKPAVVKEVVSVLKVFKQMIDAEGVEDTICYATSLLDKAKNNNGFVNEIAGLTGLKFSVVSPEDELNWVYTAIINTFNKPKALIIHLSSFSTSFMLYNRRNIMQTKVVNYGYVDAYNDIVTGKVSDVEKYIRERINPELKDCDWIFNVPEEFEVIGSGDMFLNLGVISRKARKYPVDIAHNYTMSKADFQKVFDALKAQDLSKPSKIKGVPLEQCRYLPTAFAIMNCILPNINVDNISISNTGVCEGMLFNYALPLTVEKPISDTLGYSLQVINEFYERKPNNAAHVYELSMILFKQLKVLHKLGRSYIKVLRIASYLYDSGLRVNYNTREKSSFNIIQNSDIYGVSHREIVLASFVAYIRNSDNFNLSDWVRYKELVTDEDLVAVKKLAVILNIAQSLDITSFGNVVDINCDILGDSVIMKTIVNADCGLEIKHAKLNANEFKKSFNKNLEIL